MSAPDLRHEPTLEQIVCVAEPVTVWRLDWGDHFLERVVPDHEMVDDADRFWARLQDAGRALSHLERRAAEVIGPPPFGLARALFEPELLAEAKRLRVAIATALFPAAADELAALLP